jgi:hypothetical protein
LRTKPFIGGLENKNGVLYLGDGSWGRLRTPKSPDKLAYLAASRRDYHLSLHRIQDEKRFHHALDEFGRIMPLTSSKRSSSNSTKTRSSTWALAEVTGVRVLAPLLAVGGAGAAW